jgi:arylsulfatase A-like enzyme
MSSRPNVLYIDCHDLGTMLGSYGEPWINSPNIDRIAAEGVRFTRNIAACPICGPSRIGMYMGILPHRGDIYGNTGYEPRCPVTPMARHFRANGYATTLIGGWKTNGTPEFAGYDRHVGDSERPGPVAAAVREECARAADRPFFVHLSFHRAHRSFGHEYDATVLERVRVPEYLPDEPEIRADLATLAKQIGEMDAIVGAALAELEQRGLLDETIVVFTTDHGPALARAKHTLFEAGITTALLMRYPARIPGGQVRTTLLSNADVYPTLCELAGIEPAPESIDGRGFAACFIDPSAVHREYAISEFTYGQRSGKQYYWPARSVRTSSHKYVRSYTDLPPYLDSGWLSRISHRRELLESWPYFGGTTPREALYDLESDPLETNNLLDAATPETAAIRDRLAAVLYEAMADDELLTGAVETKKVSPIVQQWIRREGATEYEIHYDVMSETHERPFPDL